MNIRTRILTLLFLTVSTIGLCQDYKKEIEAQFLDYNKLIVGKEFEKSMSYAPEELFTIIPKEQMVQMMEKTFNNPDMEFELKVPEDITISDVEEISNKFYSLLSYSSVIKMKFRNVDGNEEETEAEHKQRMNLTKTMFQQAYGTGNVKYDKETDFFEVKVEKQAYAISKDGKTDWKFLVLEKKQKPFLNKLLPKQLVDKI